MYNKYQLLKHASDFSVILELLLDRIYRFLQITADNSIEAPEIRMQVAK